MSIAAILCYHKVGLEVEEGRRLNISPSRLTRHVRFFVRRAWPFQTASQLAGTWPDRSVVFTFDDAYESALKNAPEVFEREGQVATFFAVPSQVGRSSAWDGSAQRALAGWDALRAAATRGHEIGNHTLSHPHLDTLSVDEQIGEIVEAKALLEAQSLESRSFCYPYGGVGDANAVRSAGYEIGLALGRRCATDSDERLRLPRIVIAFNDDIPMLLYKLYLKPKLIKS